MKHIQYPSASNQYAYRSNQKLSKQSKQSKQSHIEEMKRFNKHLIDLTYRLS